MQQMRKRHTVTRESKSWATRFDPTSGDVCTHKITRAIDGLTVNLENAALCCWATVAVAHLLATCIVVYRLAAVHEFDYWLSIFVVLSS